MGDKNLIEAVRMFDCLWKVNTRVYRDLRAKENAWKEVSNEVSEMSVLVCSDLGSIYFFKVGESSVEDCQRRWKGLRDKYVREAQKKQRKRRLEIRGPWLSLVGLSMTPCPF